MGGRAISRDLDHGGVARVARALLYVQVSRAWQSLARVKEFGIVATQRVIDFFTGSCLITM